MSRRRKKIEGVRPATPDQERSAIREAAGRSRSGYPTYRPARRLRCSACRRTWAFYDALNCGPCPSCKAGRLS